MGISSRIYLLPVYEKITHIDSRIQILKILKKKSDKGNDVICNFKSSLGFDGYFKVGVHGIRLFANSQYSDHLKLFWPTTYCIFFPSRPHWRDHYSFVA